MANYVLISSLFTDSILALAFPVCVLLRLLAAVCRRPHKSVTVLIIIMMSVILPRHPHHMATPLMTTTTTKRSLATAMAADSRCSIDSGVVVDQGSCGSFLLCLKGRVRAVPCGRDLLFNARLLTCDLPHNVRCGTRPRHPGPNFCYTAMVNVTLQIRNDARQPTFERDIQIRAPRQPLRYMLLMAAGVDPAFRYQTRHFEGYGDYVTAINGVSNDVTEHLAAWQLHSRHFGLIVDNLDDFIPEDNDVISFVYVDALEEKIRPPL